MANGPYFRFDDDNRIKYRFSHNHLQRNGQWVLLGGHLRIKTSLYCQHSCNYATKLPLQICLIHIMDIIYICICYPLMRNTFKTEKAPDTSTHPFIWMSQMKINDSYIGPWSHRVLGWNLRDLFWYRRQANTATNPRERARTGLFRLSCLSRHLTRYQVIGAYAIVKHISCNTHERAFTNTHNHHIHWFTILMNILQIYIHTCGKRSYIYKHTHIYM